VARLLASLGAREELAAALLAAPESHQEGIVEALLSEGMAAGAALLGVLLKAPVERQQTVINALAALKLQVDLDRYIDEAIRATRDPGERQLLQRVQRAPAAPFRVAGDTPPVDVEVEAAAVYQEQNQQSGSRLLRLFDRQPSLPSTSQQSGPPADTDE